MSEPVAAASRALARLGFGLSGLGLILMTVVISWQVFGRYVLHASPSWSEQLALVLMNWIVLVGAAVGVREGFHIRILAGLEALPGRLRSSVEIAAHAVVGLVGAAMAAWGVSLMAQTWHHTIPTLGIPRGLAYLPLPISGALIVFFIIEHVAAAARGAEVRPLWS